METASLQLPKDLIEAAIKDNVQKALAESFADNKLFVGQIVSSVINQKVDANLKPSSYSTSKPMIEQTLSNALTNTVAEILTEEVSAYKAQLKQTLMAELKKKNSPLIKNLVNSMAEGMLNATSTKWRFSVNIGD